MSRCDPPQINLLWLLSTSPPPFGFSSNRLIISAGGRGGGLCGGNRSVGHRAFWGICSVSQDSSQCESLIITSWRNPENKLFGPLPGSCRFPGFARLRPRPDRLLYICFRARNFEISRTPRVLVSECSVCANGTFPRTTTLHRTGYRHGVPTCTAVYTRGKIVERPTRRPEARLSPKRTRRTQLCDLRNVYVKCIALSRPKQRS